jgi:TolB-like protein
VALIASRWRKGNDAPSLSIHSIAVLPLKNLTGNAANDYLSDGVTKP